MNAECAHGLQNLSCGGPAGERCHPLSTVMADCFWVGPALPASHRPGSNAKYQTCRTGAEGKGEMNNEADPLAQFGLEAIDLRWTLRDIAARRSWMINNDRLAKLIELGLVAMREDAPYLTTAGQHAIWD